MTLCFTKSNKQAEAADNVCQSFNQGGSVDYTVGFKGINAVECESGELYIQRCHGKIDKWGRTVIGELDCRWVKPI